MYISITTSGPSGPSVVIEIYTSNFNWAVSLHSLLKLYRGHQEPIIRNGDRLLHKMQKQLVLFLLIDFHAEIPCPNFQELWNLRSPRVFLCETVGSFVPPKMLQ